MTCPDEQWSPSGRLQDVPCIGSAIQKAVGGLNNERSHFVTGYLRVLVLGAALAGNAVALGPRDAAAQGSCIWNCTCEGIGCSCFRGSTGGSQCAIGSNGCAITFCELTSVNFFVTPSGTAVLAPSAQVGDEAQAAAEILVDDYRDSLAPSRAGWRTVEPGVSVLTDCRGFTVARFIDPGLTRSYKAISQALTL